MVLTNINIIISAFFPLIISKLAHCIRRGKLLILQRYVSLILRIFPLIDIKYHTITQTFFLSFQVVRDSCGIYTVFWGFSAFSLLGLFFMLAVLPETKGKSFASIQAQLRRDVARDNASKLMTVEY